MARLGRTDRTIENTQKIGEAIRKYEAGKQRTIAKAEAQFKAGKITKDQLDQLRTLIGGFPGQKGDDNGTR